MRPASSPGAQLFTPLANEYLPIADYALSAALTG